MFLPKRYRILFALFLLNLFYIVINELRENLKIEQKKKKKKERYNWFHIKVLRVFTPSMETIYLSLRAQVAVRTFFHEREGVKIEKQCFKDYRYSVLAEIINAITLKAYIFFAH